MPQEYVIWIQTVANGLGVGWLAKNFEVSVEDPVPATVPANREQVVLTNTASYNSIVAVYEEYTTAALFVKNGTNIDVSGAVTASYAID